MQDPCDGITFKGNMIDMSYGKAMFVLSPRAKNVNELTDMGLTMSDLPLHSFQRDAIFLGEHIASEVKSAHKLDKLSKKLQNEKNLSNLNFSLGWFIKNEFKLITNDPLIESCRSISGRNSVYADEASFIIIKALWKRLQELQAPTVN